MALQACVESSKTEVDRTRLFWEQQTGVWSEAKLHGSGGVKRGSRKILSVVIIGNRTSVVKHSALFVQRAHNCSQSAVTDKIESDVEKISLRRPDKQSNSRSPRFFIACLATYTTSDHR
ncbi:hypothetical protein ARMGADRAFT_1088607 [Armillaria gallica]|uniref:Uncharacterized protein n=1 Tax=Armillaria gallica TaxID=47427 RepID=A0A2H3CQK8_ARMGA|nr:hypothetical protein ARMGADRAFT_1088607 [Armillaria gallica]